MPMTRLFLITFLISASFSTYLPAQTETVSTPSTIENTDKENGTLFGSDTVLKIKLRFDITSFVRRKHADEYTKVEMTYYPEGTDSVTKTIQVKARGKIRQVICDFPPLTLNFRSKDTIGGIFSGMDKVKLVSYCKKGYGDEVLREYLIYKLFNALTDCSFRVRLLEVNFVDTGKKGKSDKEYCFLIEPVKLLEKRKNLQETTSLRLSQDLIRPESLDRTAIFNYMIGNTDWSVFIQHNIRIFAETAPDGTASWVTVPFDFDYSGLVDANYAVPYENLPIKSVRDRYYLGLCRSREEYEKSLREFSEKKEEFYRIIRDFPYLKAKTKNMMLKYLDGFYYKLEKRNPILNEMLFSCLNR
jgi:hypothetical protein